MPHPRYQYYLSDDFQKTLTRVNAQIEDVTLALGELNVKVTNNLLLDVEGLSIGLVGLGGIFNVILLLMIMISSLLIYSLLMHTIEQKMLTNGVMRMVGVSK